MKTVFLTLRSNYNEEWFSVIVQARTSMCDVRYWSLYHASGPFNCSFCQESVVSTTSSCVIPISDCSGIGS